MSELNLQIFFDDKTEIIKINNNENLNFFCNYIRNIFKKYEMGIEKYYLIIFNGIPPKKINEFETDQMKTLNELKILNNSIIRICLDNENLLNPLSKLEDNNINLNDLKNDDKKGKNQILNTNNNFLKNETQLEEKNILLNKGNVTF